jgi:triacylglycerol lipase
MHKPVPPAKYSQIAPPNANYTYFEHKERYPFVAGATGFNLVNAGWMADFALLAYGDEAFINGKLERSGLTAAGFKLKLFSRQTTQCFVAHNEEFAVLSFRGTEIDNFMGAFADWVRNLDFKPVDDASGGRLPRGFAQDIAAVWNDGSDQASLKGYLQQILASGTRTLWITGHSLGAALAVLAAERAVREGGFTVNGVYTFGCPYTGDASFKRHYSAQDLQSRTYRFVNSMDVVRRLPPGDEYEHVGQLKFIDSGGHVHEDLATEPDAGGALPLPTRGQERAVRLFGLLGRRISALLENLFRLTIPAPFADHAPIYYAVHIWNNLPASHLE